MVQCSQECCEIKINGVSFQMEVFFFEAPLELASVIHIVWFQGIRMYFGFKIKYQGICETELLIDPVFYSMILLA